MCWNRGGRKARVLNLRGKEATQCGFSECGSLVFLVPLLGFLYLRNADCRFCGAFARISVFSDCGLLVFLVIVLGFLYFCISECGFLVFLVLVCGIFVFLSGGFLVFSAPNHS